MTEDYRYFSDKGEIYRLHSEEEKLKIDKFNEDTEKWENIQNETEDIGTKRYYDDVNDAIDESYEYLKGYEIAEAVKNNTEWRLYSMDDGDDTAEFVGYNETDDRDMDIVVPSDDIVQGLEDERKLLDLNNPGDRETDKKLSDLSETVDDVMETLNKRIVYLSQIINDDSQREKQENKHTQHRGRGM